MRWARILRGAGHAVKVSQHWEENAHADVMLALHARRSHASIKAFHGGYLAVALTGTDLYRDLPRSVQARESLELADRLIVLQPKALEALPSHVRAKARVVIQSSGTGLRQAPVPGRFRICVVGHLRPEKDPLRALAALGRLRGEALEIVQLGAALDPALGAAATAAMARERRYRWLGDVPHARALRWMASSHALVISSRMEGGANVLSEALRIGLPVLASRIPGNVGLLGTGYRGYFPVGDTKALARLMGRAAGDRGLYSSLKRQVTRLRPMVDPRRESAALLAALLSACDPAPRPHALPADPRDRSG